MTAPKEGMACLHCVFYEKTPGVAGSGECRRHAPGPNNSFYVPRAEGVGVIKTDSHWPKVFDGNWCGEFQPRT